MTACLRRPVILAIALLSLIEPPAFAGWKVAGVGQCDAGNLAIDSAGTTHILCSRTFSSGSELMYYLTYSPEGRRGPALATRPPVPYPRDLTIMTDSHNRPHVTLIAGTGQLVYLDFNGHGWHAQTIDPNLGISGLPALPLILDSNDHPHIAYAGSSGVLNHAFFDGTSWQIESTGASITPTAIQIAKDGTVHIAGLAGFGYGNSQVCEERGLKGSWTGECFDASGPALPSLALAPDGTPEVVYEGYSSYPYATIKVAHFDGINWSTESTFDGNAFGVPFFATAAIAIDSSGRAKVVLEGGDDNLYYVAQEGNTWELTNLGSVGILQVYELSLRVDPIGLPHATFWTNDVINIQLYVALTLPDLSDHWKSVVSHLKSGRTVVTGKLVVNNLGTAPTSGSTVNYYLSTDNQFDPGDKLLGSAKLAVRAGQSKVLDFTFSPVSSVSGQYLIAVTTPNNSPDEVNANSNIAAALIQ